MAESPSSSLLISTHIQTQYDVFVSFRGEDVRNNFLSHLQATFKRKGITAFIDDELKRGEEISPALLKAIQSSLISIVLFSSNYASSKWCLSELLEILECRRHCGQIVMPIFYQVDSSDVRKQAGSYAKAFNKYEETLKDRKDEIQRWKDALTKTANLSGWDLGNKQEAAFIEEISHEILKKLNRSTSIDVHDGLVGIEARMERIESSLYVDLSDVCILGIWGMGGIGKTTLARALFDKIKAQFEGCCFLKNIRENQMKHGLSHLQEKLLAEVLEERHHVRMDISRGFLKKRLRRKKVLIVLDDINDMEQLEDLVGGCDWFGPGSRIIITTRDKQLLNWIDKVYEAEHLTHKEAMQLFSHHAFRGIRHPPQDYTELSTKAVNYAGGIPLALKVLGSCLCGKDELIWKSKLAKLERLPNEKIHNVLKVSFEGLDRTEKDIFLDVACFFKGDDIGIAKGIWDACGFFPEDGLSVLIDKCLLSITDNFEFQMHDLIEEMGKEIVRQEDVDKPGKRSRLWDHEDIINIFKNNTGTEGIKGILLDLSKIKELELAENAFAEMTQLRFLKFFSRNLDESTTKIIRLPHGLKMLPNSLIYLSWDGYPYKFFASNFDPDKLFRLDIRNNCIRQLCRRQKIFTNLKHIDLRYSKYLSEVPDLSEAQYLEYVSLKGCIELCSIHPCIGTLSNLKTLDLSDCRKLRNVWSSICLKSLEMLDLSGCSNLQNFPAISHCMEHLSYLSLSGSAISNLPSSIENFPGLVELDLAKCRNLVSLPDSICNLKRLQDLRLDRCENLQHLPENIGNLGSLLRLYADGTSIEHVPSSIVCLKSIQRLSFDRCRGRKAWSSLGFLSWPFLPRSSMAVQLPPLGALKNLVCLCLRDCNLVVAPTLHNLPSLVHLDLSENNFESLPESIYDLPQLHTLVLSYCTKLVSLPKRPSSLSTLEADECTSLESIMSFEFSDNCEEWIFRQFKFANCLKLKKQCSSILESIIRGVHLEHKTVQNLYDQGLNLVRRVIFPGSEIPEWFSDQTTGSSITLHLPPHYCLDKCLGFALCVILSPHDTASLSDVSVHFRLICQDNGEDTQKSGFHFFRVGKTKLSEDHLVFGFVSMRRYIVQNCWPKNCNHIEGFVKFSADLDNDAPIKVKMCAVRLVNVEEDTQPTFHSSSLS